MNWDAAQKLECDFWCGMANDLSNSGPLLVHLGHLANAFDYIRKDQLPECLQKMLEVGVGPLGIGSLAIVFPGVTIQGVDPLARIALNPKDPHLRAIVDDIRHRVRYMQAPAEKLMFETEEFDLVATHNCVDHCQDAMTVIGEAVRVLRKGGAFLLTVHTFSQVGRLKFETMRRLHPKVPLYVQHPWTFTHRRIRKELERLGLEIKYAEGAGRAWLGRSQLSRFQAIKR